MTNLRTVGLEELQRVFDEWGEPRYRAAQVHDWIWKKHAGAIGEMTNLPKALRDKLGTAYYIPKVAVHHTQHSEDGTVKNRFVLHDTNYIEGVLIPTDNRVTACVSSQVGCSLSCKFCATGYLPRTRNLLFDEIVDEVTLLNEQSLQHYGRKLSNIVFMGMGEPLLNYKEVLKAIDKITSPEGLGMSPRRITVSTAGVAKMIRQLGDDGVRFKLALSLHAPTDAKRSEVMPINDSNNIAALVDALNYFYKKTKGEITFEYILFKDFNDSIADAEELVKIYRRVPADLINLIEYNPIGMARFQKPDEATTDNFVRYLESKKVNVHLRRSRGKDIDAACGQLANVGEEGVEISGK